MIREVCLFDKFSYCKNGVRCLRIHLKEVCWNRECDYRKCNKRHPRPCKSFMEKGFCRFGTSWRYSHRPPKVRGTKSENWISWKQYCQTAEISCWSGCYDQRSQKEVVWERVQGNKKSTRTSWWSSWEKYGESNQITRKWL